jgi:DNA-binding transcriptional MerR regulator
MKEARSFRIGEVAGATGVTVETLRYYERERLLPPVLRSSRGARRYSEDAIAQVQFIRQAQSVGLTLKDIRVLLAGRTETSRTTCRRIRSILASRIQDIDARVLEMQTFRDVLREHLRACDQALNDATCVECPTIGAIQGNNRKDNGAARP